MIGTTVGKYRIVGKLGRGGMGTVYRAIDETLDREVAIKVLNSDVADAKLMARFRAEATTLAKLSHPEIATIFEIHKTETDLFMVMELVRGETLEQLSVRVGPLAADRAAHLIAQILNGLGHAHRAGIVHRDLKPANVMISESGLVKLMDFGIARVLGAEHLTSDGTLMGTPAYMAPEQILGTEIDARADLYAAGVVFYRLLTGCVPFQAETPIAVVHKQLWDAPPPLRTYRKDLPDWCETILARALTKSPDDRFQTADEFRGALLAALGYTPALLHGDTVAQAPAAAGWLAPTTPAGGLTPAEIAAAQTMTLLQHQGDTPSVGSSGADVASAAVPSAPDSAALAQSVVMAAGVASAPSIAVSLSDLADAPAPGAPGAVSVAPPELTAAVDLSTNQVARAQTTAARTAGGSRRTAMLAAGVALLVLVVGGVAYGLRARPSNAPAPTVADAATAGPAPAAVTVASTTVDSVATSTSGDTAGVAATPDAPADADRAAAPASPAPKRATSSPARGTPAATAAPAPSPVATPVPAAPAPVDPAVLAPAPAPASVGNTLPPVTFSAQTVVVEDGKNRQKDTNIELANGTITVTGKDQKLVTSIPYDTILGLSYSNSKQPMWNTPQGPAEIAHIDGGAFGFLKGGQNWVSVRTEHMSLVWRVRDQDSRRVILAIEERTGKKVDVVKPR